MMPHKQITSLNNTLVKQVLALKEKARERKKTGLFIIEGKREFDLAKKGNYQIETLLICPEINDDVIPYSNIETTQISKKVYEKLAHRGSTEGILGIAKAKKHLLSSLKLTENPLILVAESPEKPGNIGALLRTADAASVEAVLIADPKSDLYNPNTIRGSVGCLFTNQIAIGSSEEIITYLRELGIRIYCAALTASKPYIDCDFTEASALVVGTESTGLTQKWLQKSDQNIIIPMQGQIDSLNVSVSAAILIFEAKRQRGF